MRDQVNELEGGEDGLRRLFDEARRAPGGHGDDPDDTQGHSRFGMFLEPGDSVDDGRTPKPSHDGTSGEQQR